MKLLSDFESRLWRLLEGEDLADLSRFHRRGFFDEAPLYTRESDVDFLPDDSANEILLRFSLKFLKSVIAYERHNAGYFAAVTVWDFPDERLVPNLFVWSGAPRELKKKLVLNPVKTPFGLRIKKSIPKLRLGERFDVLEDTATVPDAVRVFLTPSQPLYHGFMTLDRFRRPARPLKRDIQ